jgi:two-component system chemotaxis response regulator CheY
LLNASWIGFVSGISATGAGNLRQLKNLEINLMNLTVLIADENDGGRRILNELLHAMGARDIHGVNSYELAEQFIKSEPIDVFVCDMHLGDDRGAELVKALRGIEGHRNGKIPILLTCSHIRQQELRASRDCGSNMLLAKPYSVSALYDRLAWIAHKPRPFIWAEGYKGPDRRFKDEEIEQEDRRAAAQAAANEKKRAAS